MTLKERFLYSDFHRVFNFSTEDNRGRSVHLITTATSNIANAVITGALYTAFLAENGIDIVRVGIISFIPYISWILSIFSPAILARFRRRQKLLLLNDYIYYGSIVLATTVMPLFADDPTEKTVWFAVFLFIGNVSNALLGSGYTAWLLRFVPQGRDMNVFVSYTNTISLVCANATGIVASIVASALAKSDNQLWFLFWLRIGSFLMFIIGSSLLYLVPKDRDVPPPQKISPLHVVTEPVRYRPFMLTIFIIASWNITQGLNASTYSYYLLETVKVPMWFTYIGSVFGMASSVFLSGLFRRLVDRTSPYKTISLFLVVYMVMELFYVFVRPGTAGLYVTLAAFGGLMGVGFSMGYNSLFYRCQPADGNRDLFATCWNLMANVSSLAGAALGTWLLAIFEGWGLFNIFGMGFYGSQMLCMVKIFFYAGMLLYVARVSPRLSASGG